MRLLDNAVLTRHDAGGMKFLNPCNDWAFKRIFGSAESRVVLICFLNDLLHGGRPVIVDVTILDPYLPSRIRRLKSSVVDVRARLTDGTEIVIEMQMYPVAGFTRRILYNGAKCVTSQLGRGHDYLKLRPVVVITVADCILLRDTAHWRSDFSLTEAKSRRGYPGGGLRLIFLELPKAKLAEVPALEPMREWLALLKSATTWSNIPRSLRNPGVRRALELAKHDSLSPSEYEAMSRRELYRVDQKNMRLQARLDGFEEGETKAERRIIKGLLRQKLSPQVIAKATGVPLKDIMKLATPARRVPPSPNTKS